jgi:putative membrane protein
MHSRPNDPLDPDVRFLLANERTLLAWIRTALAVMAGGLALTQFSGRNASLIWVGAATVALSAIMAVVGYARFRAADRAIRAHKLPPAGRGPMLQVAGVLGFATVLVTLELAHVL